MLFDLSQLAGIAIGEWPRNYSDNRNILAVLARIFYKRANFAKRKNSFKCMPTISKAIKKIIVEQEIIL